MLQTATHPLAELLRREIDKFLAVSRRHAEHDLYLGRRSARRHYRSWPLLVGPLGSGAVRDVSVTLFNASENGFAFRSESEFAVGTQLAVKLFWQDPRGYWMPAVVRHCDPNGRGHIVGCEFELDDPEACRRASESRPRWFDA